MARRLAYGGYGPYGPIQALKQYDLERSLVLLSASIDKLL